MSRLHGYSKTIHTSPPSISIAAGACLETVRVEARRKSQPPPDPQQQQFQF